MSQQEKSPLWIQSPEETSRVWESYIIVVIELINQQKNYLAKDHQGHVNHRRRECVQDNCYAAQECAASLVSDFSILLICWRIKLFLLGVIKCPINIVLALGINDRSSNPQKTSIQNLKTMLTWIKNRTDSSNIFLTEINYSKLLQKAEQTNIDQSIYGTL